MIESFRRDYGFGSRGNDLLVLMGMTLNEFVSVLAARLKDLNLSVEDRSEWEECIVKGVNGFEKASSGVDPRQKLIVGAMYTLNALREWRDSIPK